MLRPDGESHDFIFGERLDTVFALPVGYSVEYLFERGLFVLGISAVLPVEVTLEGSLYHIRLFTSLFTRTLTLSLEEPSVYPDFGQFHTPELYVLLGTPIFEVLSFLSGALQLQLPEPARPGDECLPPSRRRGSARQTSSPVE